MGKMFFNLLCRRFFQNLFIAAVSLDEVRPYSLCLRCDKKVGVSALNGTYRKLIGVCFAQTSDARTVSVGTSVTNISQHGGVSGASGKVEYIMPEHARTHSEGLPQPQQTPQQASQQLNGTPTNAV